MKGTWESTGGGGGGAGTAAIFVAAVLVLAAVMGPIVRAVTDLVEVAAIITAAVLGLVLAGGGAFVVWRLRHSRANAPLMVSRVSPVTYRASTALPVPQVSAAALPPAQGATVHLHFHGMSAGDIAAIVAQHGQAALGTTEE